MIAVLALGLPAGGCGANDEHKPAPIAKASAGRHFPIADGTLIAEISAAVRVALPRSKVGDLRVEIDGDSIRVAVTRPAGGQPMTKQDNAATVTALVQAAIDVLLEHGHDPDAESTSISAWDWEPLDKRSPTGKPLRRSFVTAQYDYNEDRIYLHHVE